MRTPAFLFLSLIFAGAAAAAAVRSVGPGQPYAKPCQALAAAQDGDVVEIDAAGSYDGDVCAITRNNLIIRGINGRARIDAAGQYAWGKGIWVVAGDNITIENIEFSGAKVPDRNGAGIRLDTGNLIVRNCVFHHNENGILGGFYGKVVVEHSEFYDNGYGDGQSHNIYINSGVAEFTLRFSASRRARVGHLVKSRASANYILYNRLTQEDGTGSYEIDLPNGGLAYVIGNVIQQSETTQNRGMLSYGFEGLNAAAPNQLYVVNNTFVSTRAAGATFIQVASAVTSQPVIRNNIFSGAGTMTLPAGAVMAGNVTSGDMGFLNAAQYDYRISNLSAALNAGVDPGTGSGYPLRPAMQYHHPLCAVARYDVGPIDAGAFEYGVIETNPVCAGPPAPPPPAPDLAAFTLSSATAVPGASVTATITLSSPAPAGGVTVALSAAPSGVVSLPASVLVPAGAAGAQFLIQAGAVTTETTVVVTAAWNGKSLQTTLTIRPATVQPVLATLGKISCSPCRLRPGQDFSVTLQLAAPAPSGGVLVRMASGSAALKVPASVVIPAGASSARINGAVDAGAPGGAVSIQATSANTLSVVVTIRRSR
ncbi:MAG: right-handed parallel beta-helix repeat-containing protein [Bryobacteraceae bacterium]